MEPRRWLAAGAAAKLSHVTRQAIAQARQRGELVGVETPIGFLYLERDVKRWSEWRQAGRPTLEPVGGRHDGDEEVEG